MIHDAARVKSIRDRAASQLALIKALQEKFVGGQIQLVGGTLQVLNLAMRQTEDIEAFFLADLDRNDRTAAEEAHWLSAAEYMMATWEPSLKRLKAHFR